MLSRFRGEFVFSKLIKLCSTQGLIIWNDLTKGPNSSWITCIHGLESNVADCVISNIPLKIQIINFDILNDHEPDLDHRPLIVTLNFVMHRDPIKDNPYSQKNLTFDRNKKWSFSKWFKN